MSVNDNLYNAVLRGDAAECQRLNGEGADVHYRKRGGRTLLHEAITYDNVDCVRILMEAGVDCMIEDSYGHIALYLAESMDAVKLLLDNNDTVNYKNLGGETPLNSMVITASGECVKFLITREQK